MGEGVPQSQADAVHWYRLAAAQGDAHLNTTSDSNSGRAKECPKTLPSPLDGTNSELNREGEARPLDDAEEPAES